MRIIFTQLAAVLVVLQFTEATEVRRLNYLQFSTLRSDLIVTGKPNILKHIKANSHLDTDIMWTSPDTLVISIQAPKYLLGEGASDQISAKLITYLGDAKFTVPGEVILFLVKEENKYVIIDLKKVAQANIYVEAELIDTILIEEKGMVGHLSINRDWKRNWHKVRSRPFTLLGFSIYAKHIRANYRLEPYCFHTPVDVGVYYVPIGTPDNYAGEFEALNPINSMMVRKSIEKKNWLEINATKGIASDQLCRTDLYE